MKGEFISIESARINADIEKENERLNNVICELEKLPDESIARMLKARVPECEEYIPNILKVYHQIQKKIMKSLSTEQKNLTIIPQNFLRTELILSWMILQRVMPKKKLIKNPKMVMI